MYRLRQIHFQSNAEMTKPGQEEKLQHAALQLSHEKGAPPDDQGPLLVLLEFAPQQLAPRKLPSDNPYKHEKKIVRHTYRDNNKIIGLPFWVAQSEEQKKQSIIGCACT